MSSRQRQVRAPSKKTGFGKKGYMHKIENKVYMHVDGKTYFVYAKTVNDILTGVKKGTSILGFE